MNEVIRFIKNWMLPIAIVAGITLFLAFHLLPFLSEAEPVFLRVASLVQPVLVSIMLFLQLTVVSPSDLKPRRWFVIIGAIQCLSFVLFSLLASRMEPGLWRILAECAMLCLIAPTAAAAGVITARIGGSISNIMAYTVIINFIAAILIPLMVPIVNPAADIGFLASFWKILKRVFSILVLPCALAWLIRYTLPSLQKWLSERAGGAFYIWGVTLTLALAIATGALVKSGIGVWETVLIGLVSLLCCLFQFWTGRKAPKITCPPKDNPDYYSDKITSGQALGQKNTSFIIWLGFMFLTPVTSVAGGLYAIFQNLVNSYELYEARKASKTEKPRE